MSLRKEFVLRALSGAEPIAALCREYGISRKTGYKWIDRFKKQGLAGLVDESRRPSSSPLKTSADTTLQILQLKKQHPTWGPKKIWGILRRSMPEDELPTIRTIARVLERVGAVKKRRRYRKPTGGAPTRPPRYSVDGPNDLWTADFKGWWKTRDGKRCEPLTVRDAYSRFILMVRILPRTTGAQVRIHFEELFERYGLPRAIQTDNGQPWASTRTPAGLTRLSAWWVSQGVELVRSRVACPQDNGAHERMHADIRIEIQESAAPTVRHQQEVIDDWVQEFNFVRPHEALGLIPPGDIYRRSPRRPGKLVVGGFPDGCEILRAGNTGTVRYAGKRVYITSAIRNQSVGIQLVTDDQAVVWFYDLPLGILVPGVDDRMQPFDFDTCHHGPIPIPTAHEHAPDNPSSKERQEVTGVTHPATENHEDTGKEGVTPVTP